MLNARLCCLFVLGSFAALARSQTPSLDDLPALVDRGRAVWQVPGVAIAVVHNDEVVFAGGFGVRRLGEEEAVDAQTLFAVASNTKAFTAALLAMAAEQGELRWDDVVLEHLPEFRLHDAHATADMRVRDLLIHNSGLPTFGGDHLWIGSDRDAADILARLRFLEPTAPFRARYQYQNLMYLVAGEVAAAAHGASWQELMRTRILDPLGMRDSLLSVDDLPSSSNVASAHERVDGQLCVVEYDDVDAIAPAAALISNVVDMAQWMRLHLAGGIHGETRLLSESTVRELHTMQFPLPVSKQAEERFGRRFSGYALGWGVSDYRGRKLVTHGGGLTGMISRQTLVPEEGLGILVLTNQADNALAAALSYTLLDRFLGGGEHDWLARIRQWEDEAENRRAETEQTLQASRHAGTQPSLDLERYVGTYSNRLSGSAQIELRDGKLWFDYNPRHIGRLEHWHHDTFRVHWHHPIFDMPAKSFLRFSLNDRGDVAELTVGFYRPNTFPRVAESGD